MPSHLLINWSARDRAHRDIIEPRGSAVTARLARLRARPVHVPLRPPLQSATGAIDAMPLLLVDATDSDGATGRAYTPCYLDALLAAAVSFAAALAARIVGGPVAPRSAAAALPPRLRLAERGGVAGAVLGALDLALWDLAARRAEQPLCRMLGADPTPVRAYASLRSADPYELAVEAQQAAEDGFAAFKVKLGHGGPEADAAAVAAVRDAAGEWATVMVDYNQTLTVPAAIDRAQRLGDLGVAWIEEPVDADDHEATARVRAASPIPVQVGESWRGPRDVVRSVAAGASDLAMPDAGRIGGVTGWLAATAVCEGAALPISSHLHEEASVHLLAATAGQDWLEWMGVATPILCEPLRPQAGRVTAADWDEDAVTAMATE
jgi:mandelate racemase